MHQPIKYRSDIDGLRALAVLSVVFYHADWWPFTGGYIGVDIFFVISGYLITTIISNEMQEGRFSFLNFYERRIRRILPALFAVLLFCSVVSYAVLSVRQYAEFSETLVATIFFLSNLSLWGHSGGYFDSAEQLKPLLHTWSLSVEEQFYILFPPVLLLVYFLSRHISRFLSLKVALGFFLYGIVVLSFALSAATVVFDVAIKTAFFFLPFRAWELGLGAILALQLVPPLHWRHGREALTILGMVFILIAVFGYGHDTQFPGYAALIPALGATLIIYAGSGAHPTWGGRLLGLRPLVFIGLISYSLYLWHWPLLAFTRIINFGNLYFVQSLIVVSVSFILAVLSWRYIERPFRGKSGWLSRRWLFSSVIFASLSFIIFGSYGVCSNGWLGRVRFLDGILYNKAEIEILNVKSESEEYMHWGDNVFNRERSNKLLSYIYRKENIKSADTYGYSYMLIGDSHAMYGIEKTLFAMAGGDASKFYSLADSGRWPVVGILLGSDWNQRPVIESILRSEKVRTVILSNRYALHLYGSGDGTLPPRPLKEEIDGRELLSSDVEGVFARYFNRTIKMLLDSGKRVVLIYPIPEVGYDVPQEMMRRLETGGDINGFYRPMDGFWTRNGFIISVMDGLGEHPNLVRIKPHEILCDGVWCKTAIDGRPLYFDDDHLSQAGVDLLRPQFEALFADPKWN